VCNCSGGGDINITMVSPNLTSLTSLHADSDVPTEVELFDMTVRVNENEQIQSVNLQ